MDLGNKIADLRKQSKLSQEELAEKLKVTRQTISKWELEETTPDIKQAKELSKIFNVSLDELTNNDINNILIKKVSNTEKLAGITIKFLRFISIVFVIVIVTCIIGFLLLNFYPSNDNKIAGKYSFTCNLDNKDYSYEIQYNKDRQIINMGGDDYIFSHTDIDKYDDANQAKAHVEDWFKDHNGLCIVK